MVIRMKVIRSLGKQVSNSSLIVLALLLTVTACNKADDANKVKKDIVRPAKIITVGSSGAGDLRSFPAEVKASERSELAFRVSGELEKLPVKAGDIVKSGQTLAQLDQTDYQLKVNDSTAKFDLTKVQFDRADKLVKDRMIPISDFDKAKSQFLAAKAELKLAQQNMQYTTLRAPIDGRISRIYIKNHENIKAQQSIMVIQSQDYIDIEFYIPESVVAQTNPIKPGEHRKVEVKFDQFPAKPYEATVKEFDTEVDPNTQSYRVLVTMKSPRDIKVFSGMSATVFGKINDSEDSNGNVILPVAAVFAEEDEALDGKRYVWKYDGDTQQVSRHAVTVGHLTDGGIIVLSGVTEGEQIIAAGVHVLKENQKVKPMVRERGL